MLRFAVNYVRQCLCKHEWEQLSHEVAERGEYAWMCKEHRWVYRCKKCGYIKRIVSNK